jgi:hypothetical protein
MCACICIFLSRLVPGRKSELVKWSMKLGRRDEICMRDIKRDLSRAKIDLEEACFFLILRGFEIACEFPFVPGH